MQISPKFNIILSNKAENKTNNQRYNFIKQNEQKDSFTSTTSEVSFKAKAPIPPTLERMLKSKNYWAILGATVTAVAASIWQQLTNNGENDTELTEDQIAELIKSNYPNDVKEQDSNPINNENIIDVDPVEVFTATENPDDINVTEANNILVDVNAVRNNKDSEQVEILGVTETDESIETTEVNNILVETETVEDAKNKTEDEDQKLKLTTLKLEPSKQSAKPVLTEKDLAMAEKIKELSANGYDVKYMSNELGVSTTKIYTLMNALGMNPPRKQRLIDAQNMTKEEVIKLCEDNLGMNVAGLSYILGISTKEMAKILMKYDIPTPRRITSAKKLEALKKAKEEEKAKEAANKAIEENTVENAQDIKPEVAKNTQEKIEEQINEETAVKNHAELNKTVLELSRQNLSQRQIADKLGISVGEVRKIFIDEIKNSVNKLQELADKGYTLEQAAEELGKDIKTVERDARRKGIVFNTNTEDSNAVKNSEPVKKVKKTKKIDIKKYSETIKKFQETIRTDIQFASSTLVLNEAIEKDINKIREDHKDKIDLINKLEKANFFSGVADYKNIDPTLVEITPQGYIRYSAKDLLIRFLARQYNVIANDKDLEARFAMAKSRGLQTIPTTALIDIPLICDTDIPENDPMFEKFVECFDSESCLKQIEIAIKKHNNSFIKEACSQELVDKINELNGPYIKIDKNVLFNIICQPKAAKSMMFYYSIPKFQNADDVTQTQKELMQAIENFKYRSFAKEYIDLVNIYNTYCGESCDEELTARLLKELKAIEKPQEFKQETIDELRSIIETYKKGVVPEIRTPDDSELYDVKTINIDENTTKEEKDKFLQECKNILDECFDDERYNNDDLLTTIIDFTDFVNVESLDDLQNLQKLIIILDDIKNNKITIKKANDICKTENIKTIAKAEKEKLEKAAKAEEKKLEEEMKKEDELRTNLNEQYLEPFFNKFNNNIVISNILAAVQGKLNNLDLSKLESLKEVLKMFQEAIDNDLKQDINKILEIIKTQFFTSDEIVELNQLIADKNIIYNIKYLKGEIELEDNYKKIVKEKFNKAEITENEAMKYLKNIDDYQALSNEDKTHITKILTIFDKDAKGTEKRLLEAILKDEYINTPTYIYNNFYNDYIEINPKGKKDLWKDQTNARIIVLKEFEEAAPYISKGGNVAGIEFLDHKEYDAWIRIVSDNGNMRIASKKFKGQNNKTHNPCFDVFIPDHKNKGKIGKK